MPEEQNILGLKKDNNDRSRQSGGVLGIPIKEGELDKRKYKRQSIKSILGGGIQWWSDVVSIRKKKFNKLTPGQKVARSLLIIPIAVTMFAAEIVKRLFDYGNQDTIEKLTANIEKQLDGQGKKQKEAKKSMNKKRSEIEGYKNPNSHNSDKSTDNKGVLGLKMGNNGFVDKENSKKHESVKKSAISA